MKKLYRNKAEGKIAGVCQGVAEYFDIDPSIVRLIWVIAIIWGGVGLILYIACALILPDKSSLEFTDYTVKDEDTQ
ncbi:MAG TPA: PspC domain-containing protein [Eubacteriaceae bacterium]|nr:PspC domain-containing protein [Eubacteriaceae bacterium]